MAADDAVATVHLHVAYPLWPAGIRAGKQQHVPWPEPGHIRDALGYVRVHRGQLLGLVDAGSVKITESQPYCLIGKADGAAAVTVIISVLISYVAVVPQGLAV